MRSKAANWMANWIAIAFFEKMLVDDGALIVKFWFHLSRKEQARRLKQLSARSPHPSSRAAGGSEEPQVVWAVYPDQRKSHPPHGFRAVPLALARGDGLAILRIGGRADPPGIAANPPQRTAARARPGRRPPRGRRRGARAKRGDTILDHVDLSQKLAGRRYGEELEKYQGRLTRLTWEANVKKISTVAVLEGWDAAGKGSAIRRVTAAIDPRLYRIIPIAAPTDEERAQPLSLALLASFAARRAWWPFSTVPGTGACWWSGWRNSPRRRSGNGPTWKSTISRSNWRTGTSRWPNSGFTSARRNSCGASRNARTSSSSATKSRRRTGATARNGTPTSKPSTTWWRTPARNSRRGRWWPETTSISPGCRFLKTLCEALEQLL